MQSWHVNLQFRKHLYYFENFYFAAAFPNCGEHCAVFEENDRNGFVLHVGRILEHHSDSINSKYT